ncbi:hypothetical protein LHK_01365 [Laribacter hongkongensis HLHK9]|uniref:Uncharacterized protein n=1 Tax=Laribacter hongkongensis (strain HLHK9) TaxID=557598 RepID=C1D7B5_LARHH|nr:hypothetical protein LHK_01365 [Laribacter hongkongensis HLHK9]
MQMLQQIIRNQTSDIAKGLLMEFQWREWSPAQSQTVNNFLA